MAKPAGVITDLFKQPLRSWRVPVTDLADLPRRVQRLRTDLAIAGDGYFMTILPAAEQLHRVIAHRYNDEAPVYDSVKAFSRGTPLSGQRHAVFTQSFPVKSTAE